MHLTGKCERVTHMDSKEAKSNWAPWDMCMGQPAYSSGGKSDSSAHKREKLWGGSGLYLGTRVSSSGCAASPGSQVLGSLGVVTLIGGSALGISDNALPSEAGAIGSFSTTSSIPRSSRLPLWITKARHPHSSCTALQSTPGGIPEWMAHHCRALAKATVSSAYTTQ